VFVVMRNAQPEVPSRPVVPTEIVPTEDSNSWQSVLSAGFAENSTPLPTIAIPTEQFIPPTIPRSEDTDIILLEPGEIEGFATPTIPPAASPTRPPPTAALISTEIPVTEQSV